MFDNLATASTVSHFCNGAIAVGLWFGSLYFYQAFRKTKDRFFLFFTASFLIMMSERIILGVFGKHWNEDPQLELRTVVYSIRFVGFLLIAYAILEKNGFFQTLFKRETKKRRLRVVPPNHRKSA